MPETLPDSDSSPFAEWLEDQPWQLVKNGHIHYYLLGTAHISKRSAEVVEGLLATGKFDAVAIELCASRHKLLTDDSQWRQTNLFELIKQGKAGMFLANLVLSGYQKRLAKQFDIEPGAEMRAAMQSAEVQDIPVQLIDREIGTTMKRISRRIGLWQRFMLMNGLIASIFTRESIDEDTIEKLKEGDMLESAFSEFAQQSPMLYKTLIDERDQYMAASLQLDNTQNTPNTASTESPTKVLAVLGAGHLSGTAEYLQDHVNANNDDIIKSKAQLNQIPEASVWPKLIPWVIVLLVVSGFAIGFARSPELGWNLVITWVLINGVLSAIGTAIARGHPLSILTALLAAPITSLNPTIGAGVVTAMVEAWIRKPRVADFDSLRDDVTDIKGWWRNRVARTLLVFFFSTLGSAIGTWVAGFSIIEQLT